MKAGPVMTTDKAGEMLDDNSEMIVEIVALQVVTTRVETTWREPKQDTAWPS